MGMVPHYSAQILSRIIGGRERLLLRPCAVQPPLGLRGTAKGRNRKEGPFGPNALRSEHGSDHTVPCFRFLKEPLSVFPCRHPHSSQCNM